MATTTTEKLRDQLLNELTELAFNIWLNDRETDPEIYLSMVCIAFEINDPYIIKEMETRAASWVTVARDM